MVKSDVQAFDGTLKLSPSNLQQKTAETNFAVKEKWEESPVTGKITEKLENKIRFARMKKRMRMRSTNIL